jgi:DNA polymerase I-like protein with 3'-5' exonuclease and polymerase domains
VAYEASNYDAWWTERGYEQPLVLDIETDPEARRVLLVGFEAPDVANTRRLLNPHRPVVVDWLGLGPGSANFRAFAANPRQPWVTFTKYDARELLLMEGLKLEGPVVDLQPMAWVMNENTPLTLEYVAKRYGHIVMDKRLKPIGGRVMFHTDDDQWVPIREAYDNSDIRPQFEDYLRRDVEAGRRVFDKLFEQLDRTMWLSYWEREEFPFTEVLLGMETAGMPVNVDDAAALREELGVEVAREDAELRAEADLPVRFNLGSNDQIAAYLFSKRFEFQDRLALPEDQYGREAVRLCLLDKDHDDCGLVVEDEGHAVEAPDDPLVHGMYALGYARHLRHVFLPEGFTVTHVGREYVTGYWSVKGQGLVPTKRTPACEPECAKCPPKCDKWAVDSPTLLINHGEDPWVQKLVSLRKKQRIITGFLTPIITRARREDGKTLQDVWRSLSTKEREREDLQGDVLLSTVRGTVNGDTTQSGADLERVSTEDGGRADTPGTPASNGGHSGSASDGLLGSSHRRESDQQRPSQLDVASFAGRTQDRASCFYGSYRVHPSFNQTGTVTGRLSSSNPNAQNQPSRGPLGRRLRELFQGDLLVADFGQLEPRILASLSGDPVSLDIFRTGQDMYQVIANLIMGHDADHEERTFIKTAKLGSQYGARERKLAAILSLNGFPTTLDRAGEILDELASIFRVEEAWKREVSAAAADRGYIVTLAGRHRRLKLAFEDRSNWKAVKRGERQAVNAYMQGGAADIVKHTMMDIAADEWLTRLIRMLAQVHDELVFDAFHPEADPPLARDVAEAVRAHGEYQATRFGLQVPLVFEPAFGSNWYEAKEGDKVDLSPLFEEDEEDQAEATASTQ